MQTSALISDSVGVRKNRSANGNECPLPLTHLNLLLTQYQLIQKEMQYQIDMFEQNQDAMLFLDSIQDLVIKMKDQNATFSEQITWETSDGSYGQALGRHGVWVERDRGEN